MRTTTARRLAAAFGKIETIDQASEEAIDKTLENLKIKLIFYT
ncbi:MULTISPECIES: hypothetical protein [unclassified Nostoc]|nr:hypothetical protein [Nostoc sp. S13]MDF5736836.1 hypothetical protein [Nostoc sp. S13]